MEIGELWVRLGDAEPNSLVEARLQAYQAVQWLARVARANLAPLPDDSHTSLSWDETGSALVSAEFPGKIKFGLRLPSLILFATGHGELELDGKRDARAGAWIDGVAKAAGLKPASGAKLPYEIPARQGLYERQLQQQALGYWYEAAVDIIEEIRDKIASIGAGPSPLRCWPHHFDIATLLTLKAGRSINIGMSPGDDHYDQPYFYVSPWPRPTVEALPALPGIGHWHTDGFLGAVATADQVLPPVNRRSAVRSFLLTAIALSGELLSAS